LRFADDLVANRKLLPFAAAFLVDVKPPDQVHDFANRLFRATMLPQLAGAGI